MDGNGWLREVNLLIACEAVAEGDTACQCQDIFTQWSLPWREVLWKVAHSSEWENAGLCSATHRKMGDCRVSLQISVGARWHSNTRGQCVLTAGKDVGEHHSTSACCFSCKQNPQTCLCVDVLGGTLLQHVGTKGRFVNGSAPGPPQCEGENVQITHKPFVRSTSWP
jgi:hypothetical protein